MPTLADAPLNGSGSCHSASGTSGLQGPEEMTGVAGVDVGRPCVAVHRSVGLLGDRTVAIGKSLATTTRKRSMAVATTLLSGNWGRNDAQASRPSAS